MVTGETGGADDELLSASASRLAAAVRAREVSSTELLDAYLGRIAALDGATNAVATLDEEGARRAAGEADAVTARGDRLGPLHGLPVTIKDALAVAGVRSTGGAEELAEHRPAVDADAVGRLRRAGAVVFGKTNCARWSGDIQTHNPLFGLTRNPWDPARTAGGSSGGSAAAVAAAFTAFELGTDVGGSIRIPAHCCGVFGLKPTFGLVPQRGYLSHVGGGVADMDMNVVGPIARAAEDLDLVLASLVAGAGAGAGGRAPAVLPEPRHDDPRRYRIGVWLPEGDEPFDPEQRTVLESTVAALSAAGMAVEDAHPDIDLRAQNRLFLRLLQAALSVSEPVDGPSISHRKWLDYDERRAELGARWDAWFEDFDVLLCPVMPVPAFEHLVDGELAERRVVVGGAEHGYGTLVTWTGLVGMVGLPAAVVPAGRTEAGVPVGVQVVAAHHRDREAVQVARAVAELCPGAGYRLPPLAAS